MKSDKAFFYGFRQRMLVSFGVAFISLLLIYELIELYGIPFTSFRGAFSREHEKAIRTLQELADTKKLLLSEWLAERTSDIRYAAEGEALRSNSYRLGRITQDLLSNGYSGERLIADLQKHSEFAYVHRRLSTLISPFREYSKIRIVSAETGEIIVSTDVRETGSSITGDVNIAQFLNPLFRSTIDIRKNQGNDHVHLLLYQSLGTPPSGMHVRTPSLVMIAHIDMDEIIRPLLYTGTAIGRTGEVNLVNHETRILTALKYPLIDGKTAQLFNYKNTTSPARMAAAGIEGVISVNDYRGIPVLAVTRHIRVSSELGIGMIVKIDQEDISAPVNRAVKDFAIFTLTGAFIILVITYFISTKLSGPVKELSQAAEQIQKGNLNARVAITGRDEIGALAHAFNAMAERIQNWHSELDSQVKTRTRELFESERSYRTLAENLPGIVYRVFLRENKRMKFYNKMSETLTGYKEEEFRPGEVCSIDFMIFPEERDAVISEVKKAIEEKRPFNVEYGFRHKNGDNRFFLEHGSPVYDDAGRPLYIDGVIFDITERKRAEHEKEILEEQLQQAQKMEAVGLLAGGVAHDFNNVLTAIIGYSHIMKEKLKNDDTLRSYAEKIILVSNRAANIVKSLLAFSRKQIINPTPVDLNDIVRDMGRMLQNLIGEDIEFRTVIHDQSLTVMADRGQMDQALINLITNARDAMPHGGSLSIETGTACLEEESAGTHLFNRPGQYAFISVSDTGTGMNAETKEKIFEPFFTTKEPGKGTGLGLSMIYGIIKQLDGNISVHSEPGKGTKIIIYLPQLKSAGKNQGDFPSGLMDS